MTFLQKLKEQDNLKFTTNGALGHESTLNSILDLSSEIGNSRFKNVDGLIDKAFLEDKVLASKLFAYARDVRQGGGDKTLGRKGFIKIANDINIDKTYSLLNLIAKYGSYKDVMYLLNEEKVKSEIVEEICKWLEHELKTDVHTDKPSLLAKYMPTETTKDKDMKTAYRTFMKYTDIKPKEYRKRNTLLRKKLDIIETKLTEKRYDDIDYSKVPSQAGFKYRQAFYRNDEERYLQFLDKAEKGETKINTGTLAPYQMVDKVLASFGWYRDNDKDQSIITMWDNLQRPDTKELNVLPVVDVSGSMSGLPMSVAMSLGMILSESITGEFKDHFITFSERPKLQKLVNGDVYDKVKNLSSADWGMNTDLEKVFDLVLNTAVSNKVTQEELPQAIIIFSDMQFDEAIGADGYYSRTTLPTINDTFFNIQKEKFTQAGYELPTLIYWNIGNGDTKPVVENTKNTLLVSGFSQNIFNSIFNLDLDDLENYTPIKALLEILSQDRYKDIEDLYI